MLGKLTTLWATTRLVLNVRAFHSQTPLYISQQPRKASWRKWAYEPPKWASSSQRGLKGEGGASKWRDTGVRMGTVGPVLSVHSQLLSQT